MATTPILRITDGPNYLTQTQNLITNPSFEIDTAGWTANLAGVSIHIDTSYANHGSQSMLVVHPGSNTGEGTFFDATSGIVIGERYTVSCWIRGEVGLDYGLVLNFRDGGGNLATNSSDDVTATGEWQRISLSSSDPAPVGTTTIRVAVRRSPTDAATAGQFNFDSVLLTKSDNLTGDYFDGDSPYAYWEGDVHGSVSTQPARDGNTIDMLQGTCTPNPNPMGYFLREWTPQVAGFKGGGVFQDSQIAEGRDIVSRVYQNVTENMALDTKQASANAVARVQSIFRKMIDLSSRFWSSYIKTPVWLEARSPGETNTRYAYVVTGAIPNDQIVYGQPFLQPQGESSVISNLELVAERKHWLSQPPMESEPTLISASQCNDTAVVGLDFDGAADRYIDIGSGSDVDNLPSSAVTYEFWVIYTGTAGSGPILGKIDSIPEQFLIDHFNGQITVFAEYTGVNSEIESSIALPDNVPTHVAVTCDGSGGWKIYFDGIDVTTVNSSPTGSYAGDATADMLYGYFDNGVDPAVRLDEIVLLSSLITTRQKWTTQFTPPELCDFWKSDADKSDRVVWFRVQSNLASGVEQVDLGDGTAYTCNFPSYTDTILDCQICTAQYEETLERVPLINYQVDSPMQYFYINNPAGSGYSANQLEVINIPILDTASQELYMGFPEKPNSIAFDIQRPADTSIDVDVQFWNGAAFTNIETVSTFWNSTELTNNSAKAFTIGAGIWTMTWTIPPTGGSVMTAADLNAIDALAPTTDSVYWIRILLNTVPTTVTPILNQAPWALNQSWIEVNEDELSGDVDSLAKMLLVGLAENTSFAMLGSRSVDRGDEFNPYIDLSGNTTDAGITISGNGFTQPSAENVYSGLMSFSSSTPSISLVFDHSIARHYAPGTYAVYLRYYDTVSATADLGSGVMKLNDINVSSFTLTGGTIFNPVGGYHLAPCGILSISDVDEFEIELVMSGISTANTDFLDLILMPIDEWSASMETNNNTNSAVTARSIGYDPSDTLGLGLDEYDGRRFAVDSTNRLSESDTTFLFEGSVIDGIGYDWSDLFAVGHARLRYGKTQRVYYLGATARATSTEADFISLGLGSSAVGLQVRHVNRYLSLRGEG